MTELMTKYLDSRKLVEEELKHMSNSRLLAELDDTLQFDILKMSTEEYIQQPRSKMGVYRAILTELAARLSQEPSSTVKSIGDLLKEEKYQGYTLNMTYLWAYNRGLLERYIDEDDTDFVSLPNFMLEDEEYCYEGDIDGFFRYVKNYEIWDLELEEPAAKLNISEENKTISYTKIVDVYEDDLPGRCGTYNGKSYVDEETWEAIQNGEFGKFQFRPHETIFIEE